MPCLLESLDGRIDQPVEASRLPATRAVARFRVGAHCGLPGVASQQTCRPRLCLRGLGRGWREPCGSSHFTRSPPAGTGSELGDGFVGRHIAQLTAQAQIIKRVELELGGNSPFVVLKDADLQQAVGSAVFGRPGRKAQRSCLVVRRRGWLLGPVAPEIRRVIL